MAEGHAISTGASVKARPTKIGSGSRPREVMTNSSAAHPQLSIESREGGALQPLAIGGNGSPRRMETTHFDKYNPLTQHYLLQKKSEPTLRSRGPSYKYITTNGGTDAQTFDIPSPTGRNTGHKTPHWHLEQRNILVPGGSQRGRMGSRNGLDKDIIPKSCDRGPPSRSQAGRGYGAEPRLATSLRHSRSIPDHRLMFGQNLHSQNSRNQLHQIDRRESPRPHRFPSSRQDLSPWSERTRSEEARDSFRSGQTTGSSFVDTSATERSSILTKSSSMSENLQRSTSAELTKDEGLSVDDAIGMYENGFDYESASEDHEHEIDEGEGEQPQSDEVDGSEVQPMDDISSNQLQHAPGVVESARSSSCTSSIERDRYGFKKASHHITLETYNKWEHTYEMHLERRQKKWQDLMQDSGLPINPPVKFPPRSAKVKRFVRKGIPPDWRGSAWFWYAGGQTLLEKNSGLYEKLLVKADSGAVGENDKDIIERDLHRTFPDNIKFRPEGTRDIDTPIVQSLRRILQAFAVHNPRIGYCQSLNFLAGLLLLFMDEEKSFWMLHIITHDLLPGTHELSLEGANVDLGVLMTSVRESMPTIWAKIGGDLDGSEMQVNMRRLPPITLCMTAWFMSCFIGTLPIESALRVWDSFFYEGSKTLFRISMAILKVGESEIRAVHDPMEIFQVVQTIPRRLLDPAILMEACFKRRNGFGHLSQETVEERRREGRALYRTDKTVMDVERSLGRRRALSKKLERLHLKR